MDFSSARIMCHQPGGLKENVAGLDDSLEESRFGEFFESIKIRLLLIDTAFIQKRRIFRRKQNTPLAAVDLSKARMCLLKMLVCTKGRLTHAPRVSGTPPSWRRRIEATIAFGMVCEIAIRQSAIFQKAEAI
jgi:hypothetical protein